MVEAGTGGHGSAQRRWVSAGLIRRSARSLSPCDGRGEGGVRGWAGTVLTADDRTGTLVQRAILDHPRTDDEGGMTNEKKVTLTLFLVVEIFVFVEIVGDTCIHTHSRSLNAFHTSTQQNMETSRVICSVWFERPPYSR